MTNEPQTSFEPLDAEDIRYLNSEVVRDAAAKARVLAVAVMVVAAVATLAWLWATVRAQQHLPPYSVTFGGDGDPQPIAPPARIDVLASTVGTLVWPALTFGLGALLWLVASHLTAIHGGTLSGFEEGDIIPGLEEEPTDIAVD